MMPLIFVLIAACFAATVNFCMRKNLENQKSARGYLTVYFIFSFLISFAFRFEFNLDSFSVVMSSIGIVAGMLNLLMMVSIARALQVGPSGLTFAFQNSASMFPALLLFFLFGAPFGFYLRLPLIIGFACLLTGLFLSVRGKPSSDQKGPFGKWLLLVIVIFLIQGIVLAIFQWRSLLMEYPANSHFLIPFSCSLCEDMWFMPGFFLVPTFVQSALFYVSEHRWFSSKELILGTIAGILNGGATFCLLMATRTADPTLRPILFPVFAVGVIFLCNLWGKKFYREAIEWKGMALCVGGVLIGSL